MEIENQYAEEAKQRWGHTEAYKQSQERVAKMTPEQWEKIKQDGDALMREIVSQMGQGAKSPEAQALIAKHYNNLRNFYEPNLEMYRGLAEMYVQDERFKAYFEQYAPGLTQFMHDAMLEYCEQNK